MQVFAERRRRLLERLGTGGGVAVIPSQPVALRNGDVEHEYRQDSDLYWLTGFAEPESVLVLSSTHAKQRAVLFVRPRDPERETWDGERAGVEGAVSRYGLDAAFPIAELEGRLGEWFAGASQLHYRLGRDRAMDDVVVGVLSRSRGKGRNAREWPSEIVDTSRTLHELRLRKDDDELASMSRAAEITRDAHLAVMAMGRPGRREFELDAVLRETFRRSGCERPAYQPIVGSGPNATILHYRAGSRELRSGELCLVDAGCEHRYYAADVTRTFPVSGTFTKAQRALYDVVLDAQLAAIDAVRPGATIDGLHDLTVRRLVEGMVRIGLLTGSVDDAIAEHKYKPYYMHRTSHWLGMDVHDVGGYYVGGKPRPFEPGMVLTVEPGLYVRADDGAAPAELRGLGVRIEDDIAVTDTGWRELTAGLPKTADDVERACRA